MVQLDKQIRDLLSHYCIFLYKWQAQGFKLSAMAYDFTTRPDRANTGSLKWQKYHGKDIIPLWVADMDFLSAPEIIGALQTRAAHGVFGYTLPYEEVEEAAIDYMQRVHGYAVQREWLVWLPGLVPGLNVACAAFGQVGDAVMTSTPVYPPFLSAPKNQQRSLITHPLLWDGKRWTFDWEAMERDVTEQTRLFLLCNPHNPVGRVFAEDELRRLADFCSRHDLVLCSDEIHCDLVLDEAVRHLCTATLDPAIAARTVTLMAPSKTYNIAGLACSFAIIEDVTLRTAFKRAANGFITEVNLFGYAGCAAAYRYGEPWRQALLATLRANRDFLYRFVAERMPAIQLRPMQATYLAWLDVSALGLDDPAAFFESHGVGLSEGKMFGDARYVRLNFGCPQAMLEEGLERMAKALAAL